MLVVALLWAVGCNREVPQRSHGLAATESAPVEGAGAEKWSVNGNDVRVLCTYYMVLEASVEYVIEVARDPSPAMLETEAWPIIRDAFENRRYLRSRVDAFGQRGVDASRIRVKFGSDNALSREKHSVTLGISEVRHRISEQQSGR